MCFLECVDEGVMGVKHEHVDEALEEESKTIKI